MNKIPTAEEFCKEKAMTPYEYLCDNLKEFAKLHVEAALKEAKERCDDSTNSEGLGEYIEKAYPLENIK